jgi:hypothetical protein
MQYVYWAFSEVLGVLVDNSNDNGQKVLIKFSHKQYVL